ncbi:hypothetical protein Tco_1289797 [Tanacetum coccineum]
MPLWKRACFVALIPRRLKIEESSAAAARQRGSSVAGRADYSFVDTMDANIRAAEERTLTIVEMVNLRALEAGARVDTLEDTGSSA